MLKTIYVLLLCFKCPTKSIETIVYYNLKRIVKNLKEM